MYTVSGCYINPILGADRRAKKLLVAGIRQIHFQDHPIKMLMVTAHCKLAMSIHSTIAHTCKWESYYGILYNKACILSTVRSITPAAHMAWCKNMSGAVFAV